MSQNLNELKEIGISIRIRYDERVVEKRDNNKKSRREERRKKKKPRPGDSKVIYP